VATNREQTNEAIRRAFTAFTVVQKTLLGYAASV